MGSWKVKHVYLLDFNPHSIREGKLQVCCIQLQFCYLGWAGQPWFVLAVLVCIGLFWAHTCPHLPGDSQISVRIFKESEWLSLVLCSHHRTMGHTRQLQFSSVCFTLCFSCSCWGVTAKRRAGESAAQQNTACFNILQGIEKNHLNNDRCCE